MVVSSRTIRGVWVLTPALSVIPCASRAPRQKPWTDRQYPLVESMTLYTCRHFGLFWLVAGLCWLVLACTWFARAQRSRGWALRPTRKTDDLLEIRQGPPQMRNEDNPSARSWRLYRRSRRRGPRSPRVRSGSFWYGTREQRSQGLPSSADVFIGACALNRAPKASSRSLVVTVLASTRTVVVSGADGSGCSYASRWRLVHRG